MSESTVSQPSRRLDRTNSAEQILEDLRGQILSGRRPRGTKLPTEKQLAEEYGVSGPTVREALRGLVTACLVEVRHGSGTYVTADTDQLIALSLASTIRLQRVAISQVVGVLGALHAYAAELAARQATAEDVRAMSEALNDVDDGASAQVISTGLARFIDAFGRASGNPLLATLCRFFSRLQFGLAEELAGANLESWRKTTGRLKKERRQLVEAIRARDAKAAAAAAHAYHKRALKVISAIPHADTTLVSDAAVSKAMSSFLSNRNHPPEQ